MSSKFFPKMTLKDLFVTLIPLKSPEIRENTDANLVECFHSYSMSRKIYKPIFSMKVAFSSETLFKWYKMGNLSLEAFPKKFHVRRVRKKLSLFE